MSYVIHHINTKQVLHTVRNENLQCATSPGLMTDPVFLSDVYQLLPANINSFVSYVLKTNK